MLSFVLTKTTMELQYKQETLEHLLESQTRSRFTIGLYGTCMNICTAKSSKFLHLSCLVEL
jgi:hypothetical protein